MKHLKLGLTAMLFIAFITVNAQEKKTFKIHTVAFYNLENLFDTINDPNKNDEASPIMEMKGDIQEVYKKKVSNMEVMEDVANDPLLLDKDYGIVHYDSPDRRGIDVGLFYQKKFFTPLHTSSHELIIFDDDSRERVYTRDQLLVSGKLENEMIHIIVNHWSSRSGGEARSRPKRVGAAKLSKKIIDSLQTIDPYAKIIIMGDFNDNPNNASIKDVLKAEEEKEDVKLKGIYNPYETFFKNGMGTTGYRDSWSLFDQIMMTQPFLEKDYSSFRFYKAGIYNKNYLVNKRGRWKGYPLRSFADGGFTDGFSDHFPVYIFLIKEIQ